MPPHAVPPSVEGQDQKKGLCGWGLGTKEKGEMKVMKRNPRATGLHQHELYIKLQRRLGSTTWTENKAGH